MFFDSYDLKDYIVRAIKDLNFKSFSQVQREVFNNWDKNKNLLVKSKTGSGKTHAFLITIFEHLDESLKEVQALIIAPTKELAMQIYKVAQHIASFSSESINIKLYVGGTDKEREIEKIKANMPQIVIGTPGKIHDLAIKENALKIYKAKYFVVDEMDMTLDQGYMDELDQIAAIVKDSKMLFCSATIAVSLMPFCKKYLDSPVIIDLENKSELKIKHIWIPIKHKERMEVLDSLMATMQPYLAIIFANKKETVKEIGAHLHGLGIDVAVLHGDLDQRQRKRTLREIADLKYQYVVASDLFARGIDIEGVSHIINFDLPYNYEFYVHRSGRTGRMNQEGIVYTLYDDLDDEYLNNLAKKGIKPEYYEIKNKELVPYKGRNTRKERIKPKTDYEREAAKFVPKDTKVKPGYKKKRQEKIKEIAEKLKKQDRKNRRFR